MQVADHFEGNEKPLATKKIKSGGAGDAIFIRLLANAELPVHQTAIPATLILMNGEAQYQEVDGRSIPMRQNEIVEIPVNHQHSIQAGENGALLILLK